MHGFMLVVEIVELSVGVDEVAFPVVGDRKARGEIQGNTVVARMFTCAVYFVFVWEIHKINIDAFIYKQLPDSIFNKMFIHHLLEIAFVSVDAGLVQ